MEKVKQYHTVVRDWLESHQRSQPFHKDIEKVIIADTDSGHFQLLMQGWHGKQFVHQLIFHLEVKDSGKVWIWLNQSDQKIASELVSRGIDREDIVLGFQPPYYRQYTGFAMEG